MDTRTLTVGTVSLVLLASVGAWAFAQPAGQPLVSAKAFEKEADEADEEVIDLATAPEPVRAAAIKLAGNEKSIKRIIKEEDEDVSTYEVEYLADGVDCAAILSAAGDLMELEKGTTEAKLPAAALAALKKDYPEATFAGPFIVTRTFYEIEIVLNGKKHEVRVDAAGNIEDASAGEHEEKSERASGRAADPGDGFRRTFVLDKSALVAEGVNPCFDLTPRTVQTYRDGNAILTITVLNETRVIDGVTTRVVEEREQVAGKPKETSRNYFAIDKATGDVYYFGEDVDEFDADGKATHPGSWLSGVNGAHFGLMFPGNPKVGDKFYQELAPGIAMDRFEIVSMDETVQTPAGKFEHCVHVVETTPLEGDVGHKWYAKGTGLVKDGNAELVSVKHASH